MTWFIYLRGVWRLIAELRPQLGGRVAVERADLVLGDLDFCQVAADAVALGERVGRVSA